MRGHSQIKDLLFSKTTDVFFSVKIAQGALRENLENEGYVVMVGDRNGSCLSDGGWRNRLI